MYIFEVMIKNITKFLIMFYIFQQLKSQIDQNGVNPFCDETLQLLIDFSISSGRTMGWIFCSLISP